MVDIKCTNYECPKRNVCRRATASDSFLQSYIKFDFTNGRKFKCVGYYVEFDEDLKK